MPSPSGAPPAGARDATADRPAPRSTGWRRLPDASRGRSLAAAAAALLLACGGATAPSGATVPPVDAPPVVVPPAAETAYVAGRSYLGRQGHVEYLAGDAPVILTAAHGGALRPAEIPDRTAAACGGAATTVTDLQTVELVLAMRERFHARFGRWPHVVLNHLARRKLDANRPLAEAACGDATAAAAYADWHRFIDVARAAVRRASGRGWYMDIHGHGHAVQRLELGYLLDGATLDLPDASLDADPALAARSSVRTLDAAAPASFAALLRGPAGLGTLYAAQGFPSVPAAADPAPLGAPYFSGGYNTARHGCGAGAAALGGAGDGAICGVQVEANHAGVRDTPANRARFGDATAVVLEAYLREHWGLRLDP